MKIGILTIHLRLHGCQSLKEKRHRISGLRDRFGKASTIAVCESGHQDSKTLAELSFVGVASDKKPAQAALNQILSFCHEFVDAEVLADEWLWL